MLLLPLTAAAVVVVAAAAVVVAVVLGATRLSTSVQAVIRTCPTQRSEY
jgi:hypothetical protein